MEGLVQYGMTPKQRSKRGLINIGIVLLVMGGLGFLRSDYVFARYAATRVSIGESEDEVRQTLGSPSGGKSSGTIASRRALLLYGDLRIGLINERVVSVRIGQAGS
jgi:hypothetical protein